MDFVFGIEAERSAVRGRELRRPWAISRLRHLDTAKLSCGLGEVDLNRILPNWLLILFCFLCSYLQNTLPVVFLLTYDAAQC